MITTPPLWQRLRARLDRSSWRDRRWVFLLWGAALLTPILSGLQVRVVPEPEVRELARTLRAVPEGRPILVIADFGPENCAELGPGLSAFLKAALAQSLRVILLSTRSEATLLAEASMDEALAAQGLREGEAAVSLGFQEGGVALLRRLREARFTDVVAQDRRGQALDDLPATHRAPRLADVELITVVSDRAAEVREWARQLPERRGQRVVAIVTRDAQPSLMPFLTSGRLAGLAAGLKGAAGLERLLAERGAATGALAGLWLGELFAAALLTAVGVRQLLRNLAGASA